MADTIFVMDTPEMSRPRTIRLETSASETTKREDRPAHVPLRLPKVTPLVVRSSGLQPTSF